jgi:hypothetical protein
MRETKNTGRKNKLKENITQKELEEEVQEKAQQQCLI